MSPRESELGVTTFATPSPTEIAATRVFAAPRELVWDAWTDPEHVPHWLHGPDGSTMDVCRIDLRSGGAWRHRWRAPDGTVMELRGEYKEVSPPERLVSTEWWGGDWPETLNTLELDERDGTTTMVCAVRYPTRQDRDHALEVGLKDSWSASHDRLADYLATIERRSKERGMGKSPGHQKWPNHKVEERHLRHRVQVKAHGEVVADSRDVIEVKEDDHPARYYFPREDVKMNQLEPSKTTTKCPFKGTAHYFSVRTNGKKLSDVVWTYEDPYDEHRDLKDRVAFDDAEMPEIEIRSEA